jgi:hypothetical protein
MALVTGGSRGIGAATADFSVRPELILLTSASSRFLIFCHDVLSHPAATAWRALERAHASTSDSFLTFAPQLESRGQWQIIGASGALD